jgi:hypothetical protein
MFISTSRLQPGNFMINDEKRLLQQYRPSSASRTAANNIHVRWSRLCGANDVDDTAQKERPTCQNAGTA